MRFLDTNGLIHRKKWWPTWYLDIRWFNTQKKPDLVHVCRDLKKKQENNSRIQERQS